ncbi:hypothetical protein PYCCODRAFT_1241805 [Trametes coccinea BRFM310]|uniref:Uncharacterized protein n=1 Tax=Trametes coccinea (strain BRFM310) TaxID=1353009 RepID=A0A1Y2IWH4_TRAC3|nr:hypothetical protein PYCCODRAFT_1241805 [Trametes coccinea BRFM310]
MPSPMPVDTLNLVSFRILDKCQASEERHLGALISSSTCRSSRCARVESRGHALVLSARDSPSATVAQGLPRDPGEHGQYERKPPQSAHAQAFLVILKCTRCPIISERRAHRGPRVFEHFRNHQRSYRAHRLGNDLTPLTRLTSIVVGEGATSAEHLQDHVQPTASKMGRNATEQHPRLLSYNPKLRDERILEGYLNSVTMVCARFMLHQAVKDTGSHQEDESCNGISLLSCPKPRSR